MLFPLKSKLNVLKVTSTQHEEHGEHHVVNFQVDPSWKARHLTGWQTIIHTYRGRGGVMLTSRSLSFSNVTFLQVPITSSSSTLLSLIRFQPHNPVRNSRLDFNISIPNPGRLTSMSAVPRFSDWIDILGISDLIKLSRLHNTSLFSSGCSVLHLREEECVNMGCNIERKRNPSGILKKPSIPHQRRLQVWRTFVAHRGLNSPRRVCLDGS